MTVYNYNLGIGWSSSGVEYAQLYRARCFRTAGIKARFIFTDMIRYENIAHLTEHIGFRDEEVIWLYSFFTDFQTAPSTYPLDELEKTFPGKASRIKEGNKIRTYTFEEIGTVIHVHEGIEPSTVQRVETICRGNLIRTDYYSCGRVFSEFFTPKDKQAVLCLRQFYNRDGRVAYEEMIEGEKSIFRFPDRIFYDKEGLVGYMVRSIGAGPEDLILIDRATLIGPPILKNRGDARVGVVVHAEHYNSSQTDEDNILWNNFYEYMFSNHEEVDCFITSTEAQSSLLRSQFRKYYGVSPRVCTLPVGCIDELKHPAEKRKKHAALTASRLASEKHVDWLVRAVILARKEISDLSFDIYGTGKCAEQCRRLIEEADAGAYIRLMGHTDLTEVYKTYEVYLSASGSEGFGLTLLEAAGSGLPIIGFDVPYGNVTFVHPGENGFLIEYDQDIEDRIRCLAESIVKLFKDSDQDSFRARSYQTAEDYMLSSVSSSWRRLVEEPDNDPAI